MQTGLEAPSRVSTLEFLEFDGNTVLCRVCGDKASGFHYGVHACEGCKGFFRRSIQQKIQYRPCLKNQQCNIMRVNRNRCQYCRLKKCIAVGMSRDAVRFGRVPKKEKEKIMEQMQRVSNQSQINALNHVLGNCRMDETIINSYMETWGKTQDSLLKTCDWTQLPLTQMYCPLQGDEHSNGDSSRSDHYTAVIRNVVEFAKGIPGFNFLNQDDQGILLKAGTFEVILVWLTRVYNGSSNTLMYMNGHLSKCPLNSSSSSFLIEAMFGFANQLSGYHLTDEETALFSALVLLAPDRPGLRNPDTVDRIQQQVIGCLGNVMSRQNPDLQGLLLKIPDIRTLNTLHSEKVVCHVDRKSTASKFTKAYGCANGEQTFQKMSNSPPRIQRYANIPSPCHSEPGPLVNETEYDQVVPLVRRYTMPAALGRPSFEVSKPVPQARDCADYHLSSRRSTMPSMSERPRHVNKSTCSSPGELNGDRCSSGSEFSTSDGVPRKRSSSDAELSGKTTPSTPPHSEHGVALKKRKYIKNWNEDLEGCNSVQNGVSEAADTYSETLAAQPAPDADLRMPCLRDVLSKPVKTRTTMSRIGQGCISSYSDLTSETKPTREENGVQVKKENVEQNSTGPPNEVTFQTLAEWAIRKELLAKDEPRRGPVLDIHSRLERCEQEKRRLPLHGIHSILERLGDPPNVDTRYSQALIQPCEQSLHLKTVSHLKDKVLRRIDSLENMRLLEKNKSYDYNRNVIQNKSSSVPNVNQASLHCGYPLKTESLMNLQVMSSTYGHVNQGSLHSGMFADQPQRLPVSHVMGFIDPVAMGPTCTPMNSFQWQREVAVHMPDDEPLNLTTK